MISSIMLTFSQIKLSKSILKNINPIMKHRQKQIKKYNYSQLTGQLLLKKIEYRCSCNSLEIYLMSIITRSISYSKKILN